MKKIWGLLSLPIILIALVVVFWPSHTPVATETAKEPIVEQKPVEKAPRVEELYSLINEERGKVGVKPLILDPLLNKSAQLKSEDMLSSRYFGHSNPNTGKHGWTYIKDMGTDCLYSSENIRENLIDSAVNNNNSKETVSAWMNSAAHKTAILDDRYETTGFGIADKYITQHFCDVN